MISESIVKFLEGLGVEYVFGVPGSTTVSLIDSISESKKIKFISSLHENASIGMADGYSRASGKIGVVVLHTTPGVTTAFPNLYNSFVDDVPLLILAGDVNSNALIKQPGLSLDDLKNVVKPVTRWSYYAKSAADVTIALERSANILNSAQPGPCCILIPEDILEQEGGRIIAPPVSKKVTITPDKHELEEVVREIDRANWPVMLVGREVKSKQSISSLVEFANLVSIPVLLESPYPSAYGVSFPQDDACFLGLFRRESEVLQGADMIIGLGGHLLTERKFYDEDPFNGETKVVHIHSSPWELGKNVVTHLPIMGTPDKAAIILGEIAKKIEPRPKLRESRRAKIEHIHSKRVLEREKLASIPGDSNGIKPWKLVVAMREALKDYEYMIIDEGVVASSYLSELFVFKQLDSLIGRSAGSLGWGLGAAIGAKLARPDKKVIAFVGDGAMLFGPQGIWTAAHYKIPLTVIICNNSGYASVSLSYDSFGKRSKKKTSHSGCEIDSPPVNFCKLAEALGAKAARLTEEKEIVSYLKRALDSDHVEVLDVHLDPKERGYEGSVGLNSSWT